MAVIKWDTATRLGGADLLSTELNSLGNGSVSSLGTEYDNGTNKYPFADIVVYLASLTPTAGGYVALYVAAALDGTNYPDAKEESQQQLVGIFGLDTATAAKRTTLRGVQLPNSKIKFYLVNRAGVALGATGNTVNVYGYGLNVA